MDNSKAKGNPIVKVAILLCVLVTCVWVADVVYDQMYDYNTPCNGSSVKTATNKGLFKITIECK